MRCHASLGLVVGWWCCWTTHDLPSLRHRCTVDIDRDPPTCLDAQGGIQAKRQPFVAGVVLKSCGLGRGVVVHIMSDVGTVNTCTPARLEALFTSSSVVIHSYHPGFEVYLPLRMTALPIHPNICVEICSVVLLEVRYVPLLCTGPVQSGKCSSRASSSR